ncbi:MAG: TIGR04086 family membrane protein [Clostridia bacterium]|nr:TIGR04086 family membrane protein [Clostridia bacterium]
MSTSSKTKNLSNENVIFDFLKGIIISIIISLGLIVLFALSLKWLDLAEKLIVPITFAIKYISVIVGSLFAVKGESKGLLKGALFGLIYSLSSFLIFSILAKTFIFDLTSLLDLVSSILLGALIGIIKVNRTN